MGSKYTSVSISGYNSSPPADDGSTASSNQITWSKHKTKLGDPLKTAVEAINSNLSTFANFGSRQVTASDTTVAGDHMKTVEIASTVTVAVTISLGDAATMAAGYIVSLRNSCAINQTVGRATSGDTIDGAASNVTLPPGASVTYKVNDGADGYLTIGYSGPKIDTDPVVVGGTDGTKKVRFEVDGLTASTTRVVTVPDKDGTMAMTSDITSPPSAASQAEQEAASSTTVYVSPGRQHFHPRHAKAWVHATYSGGTPSAAASSGITGLTDTATGQLTVNWTTAFSSASYGVAISIQATESGSTAAHGFVADGGRAAGSVRVDVNNNSSFVDPNAIDVVAFGDL